MSNCGGLLVLCAVLSPALAGANPPRVRPIAECVVDYGDGSYSAHFGYDNKEGQAVSIPLGFDNLLFLGPADRGQPTVFQPGRSSVTEGGFTVRFEALHWAQNATGGSCRALAEGKSLSQTREGLRQAQAQCGFGFVAWKLGPQIAWAWAHSPRCTSPPATPNAVDDTATTSLNRAVTIPVLANDSDPQGDTLSIDRVSAPAHGTATLNPDATITYTPASGYAGTDSFTYTVSDGNTGTDQASVTVTVSEQVPPPDLLTGRLGHTATLLADGKVLVAGGSGAAAALASAEAFDPQAHAITALAGALQTARQDHTATLLPRGEAFLFAGTDSGASFATAEVYSPSTQTFEPLSAYTGNPRFGHTATLLLDGRVLILGGLDSAGPTAQTEAFDARPDPFSGAIFDPRAGTFTPLPHALRVPRLNHTATLLPNGQVLVVGGRDQAGDLASAELFDPVSGDSTLLPASLGTPRTAHTATLRPDGSVVIAGGAHDGVVLGSLEVYDPATQSFSALAASLATPRAEHTATLLPTGEIWIAGGYGASGVLATSETLALTDPDTVAPQIRATLPVSGVESVAPNAIFGIRFSEPVNPATVNATTVRLTGPAGDVAGTVSIAEGGLYAFFVPDGLLSLDTPYTLTLAGIRDMAGNLLPASTLTYRTSVRPVIDGVTPDHGPAGTAFSLTGTGFDPLPDRNRVSLGGAPATVTSASATSLACTVPSDATVGPTPVSLQTPGGSTESAALFTVEYPVPVVSALAPPEIVQGTPGVVISVTGSGFAAVSVVSFGGTPVPTTYVSGTELTATVPVSALGTVGSFPVLVTNPIPGGGASNSLDIVVVPPAVVALSVAPLKASLVAGEERPFFATALRTNGLADDLTATATWASDNTAVATVSAGIVTAHAAGSATVTATASGFSAAATVDVTPADPVPPDPATVAPPLDLTIATTIDRAGEFLYAGQNPIQRGVAPNTIDPARAAILRGRVLDANGSPLPGVTITIFGHPELGRTMSRADGVFDMAVNGGGPLTARYDKPGYLAVDRQIEVPWQDWTWLPDVVMIARDPQMTTVNLTLPGVQVARGTVVTDEDGTRQATLLFVPGTQATLEYPDGTAQPLSLLHVRATEFTIGSRGPERMPALLPPTSAYTYCLDFSADEGREATRVTFNRPVLFYVENFLGIPDDVGVPLGYYNRERGVWEAYEDGRTIKILTVENGLAVLDLDGDGVADDATVLAQFEITDAERERLATIYSPGQSLWRFFIPHFSFWDPNMGVAPPEGVEPPPGQPPTQGPDPEEPEGEEDEEPCENASVIGCLTGSLGESLPVTGTPFSLVYSSDRTSAHHGSLSVRLSGATVPAVLDRIDLEISIAGKTQRSSFGPAAGLTHTFVWDGLDAYGRPVQGRQPVTVRTRYIYPAQYYGVGAASARMQSFGRMLRESRTGWTQVPGRRALADVAVERTFSSLVMGDGPRLGAWDAAKAEGLGAWTLDVHHSYDPRDRRLYKGSGARVSATAQPAVVPTLAGTGDVGDSGDGGPARYARFSSPQGLAFGPDGSLYVADAYNNRIRRIGPDGLISTVAGDGTSGFSGDGGPATQAQLAYPYAVAMGPNGELYIADTNNHRVRRVGRDGIIMTVAGNGAYCQPEVGCQGDQTTLNADGVPAVEAGIQSPIGVAAGKDGSLYIVHDERRLRRVAPDGIITTLLEGSSWADWISGVAVGRDGSVYLAEAVQNRVRRLDPGGALTVLAGTGEAGFSGDGGPATQAQLHYPVAVAVGPDDSVYIAHGGGQRLRRVFPSGRIISVAGSSVWGFGGENGPAGAATFSGIQAIAVNLNGQLVVADSGNRRIRTIDSFMPRYRGVGAGDILVADQSGEYVHVFDGAGSHKATYLASTGAMVYRFFYVAGGLSSVWDGDGNSTEIVRDVSGKPTAIMAPGGQQTALTTDGNGYLTSVSNPAGETTQLEHSAFGLLTKLTDARNGEHRYTYEAPPRARLIRDENPAGGFKALGVANKTTTVTTALGRSRNYRSVKLPTEEKERSTTDSAGLATPTSVRRDGTRSTVSPDGMQVSSSEGPDPRWGMQAPVARSLTLTRPSGLAFGVTTNRSVALSDPSNPLSLETQTDTVTVNGRAYSSIFTRSTQTRLVTSPAGRQRTELLDLQGRVTESRVPGLAPTLFQYDTRGLLTAVSQGARSLGIGYDSHNRPMTLTDSLFRQTRLEYDNADRVNRKVFPDGREVRLGHDKNSNVTSVTPPGRPPHLFDYSAVDLQASYSPPDVGGGSAVTTYGWDLDKASTGESRPDGRAMTFDYDSAGRVSTLTTPEGQTTYSYDPTSGNVTTVTAPDAGLSFGYDGSLLTGTTWTGSLNGSVSRTFDENLRVFSETVSGSTVTYGYDDDGFLTRAGDLTVARNAQNGLITGTTLGSVTDSYVYNEYGEVSRYTARFGTTELFDVQYTRDDLGRITQRIETIDGITRSFEYGYDDAGRLANVKRNGEIIAAWTYDANGNRLTAGGEQGFFSGTYNDRDQLLTYGDASYSYSPAGEMVSKVAGGRTTTYTYDTRGILTGATLPDGRTVEYLLDATGWRVGTKVDGVVQQRRIYGRSLEVLAELDDAGQVISRFVFLNPLGSAAYMTKAGRTYRIISDHLGSARIVVDATSGEIVQRLNYDAWGQLLQDSNPGFQPFAYTGREWDSETGMYHFRRRAYDPWAARFISDDPIGFLGGGVNLYAYVENNPARYLDPFGLEVVNLSGTSVVVKPETGPPGTVPSNSTYPGKVDGVKGPDGKWVKFRGEEDWWSPDNKVEVTKEGEVKCVGGLCKVISPEKLDEDPDAGWKVPKNPKDLPGCKRNK